MKLKIVILDLEIPRRVKKWGLWIGVPVTLLLGGGAIAYASTLVTWSKGQTLTASDLNGNFSSLQSEIAALQTSVSTLQSSSGFHLSTNCSYVTNTSGNNYSACSCAANEIAISGGGYIEGSVWMQASNSAGGAEWDIACADAMGNRVSCTHPFVMCSP
jgi:hypothetical protein